FLPQTPVLSFRAAGFFFCGRRRDVNAVLRGSHKRVAGERAPRLLPRWAARAPAATAIRGNPRAGMRAITVSPGTANSARLEEVPEPPESDGAVLVRTWALRVVATHPEILAWRFRFSPPGQPRPGLRHGSLG